MIIIAWVYFTDSRAGPGITISFYDITEMTFTFQVDFVKVFKSPSETTFPTGFYNSFLNILINNIKEKTRKKERKR